MVMASRRVSHLPSCAASVVEPHFYAWGSSSAGADRADPEVHPPHRSPCFQLVPVRLTHLTLPLGGTDSSARDQKTGGNLHKPFWRIQIILISQWNQWRIFNFSCSPSWESILADLNSFSNTASLQLPHDVSSIKISRLRLGIGLQASYVMGLCALQSAHQWIQRNLEYFLTNIIKTTKNLWPNGDWLWICWEQQFSSCQAHSQCTGPQERAIEETDL